MTGLTGNGDKLKTVHNGKLVVDSVPHTPYPEGIGPDGEGDYLNGYVIYQLAKIFRYMIINGIQRYNYSDWARADTE